MGIRQWLANKILKAANVVGVSSWQSGRTYYPDTEYRSLVSKYTSWVYACANKNAISCAQIPLRLYANRPRGKTKALFPTRRLDKGELTAIRKATRLAGDDVEEVMEHPILDLLATVNPYMNGFDLMELSFLCLELTGNSYWLYFLDGSGQPIEIWPLRPQYVKIVPSKEKFIEKYEFTVSATEKYYYEPELIEHFKYPNPNDSYYGLGPLQACVVAADLSSNMNIFETNLMQNMATPDYALVLPAEAGIPSDEEQKRQEKKWRARRSGLKNTGKMVIVTGGAKLEQLNLSPKEISYLQGRKATLTEIAAVFGVPMSKLTTDDVNRANAEAGDYSYMKDTILPRLRKFEQKLNEGLCPFYGENLFFCYDNPVPEDKEYRLKQLETRLKTGETAINEERAVDGLDSVEWGDKPILPMTMVPFDSSPPPKEGGNLPKSKSSRTLPPLNHPTDFVNEPLKSVVSDVYKELRSKALRSFDENIEMFSKSAADDWFGGFFDMQKWEKQLSDKIWPYVEYTFMSGARKALKSLNIERMFNPLQPRVMEALERHRFMALSNISKTTAKEIRNVIAGGMAEGQGPKAIRSLLQEKFDFLETYQAERIARTETIWAWNEGAIQGYEQSGVVSKLKWLSSTGPRTCSECLEMDGKVAELDGVFPGGIDHPPLHPQCRCTVIAVLKE